MIDRQTRRDGVLTSARRQCLIMGILNTTPDSFSDGGDHLAPDDALARARMMLDEGADIIDVGGESTRPGAEPVPEAEERVRTVGIVSAITASLNVPVSIDTYKSGTARAAAEAGAVIINDISGLLADPDMARTVAETESAVVITYNRGEADPARDIRRDMPDFFEETLALAARAGVPKDHVLLDPGVGFAKTYEQNFDVLAHLDVLQRFDCPVLVGTSRKSFIGKLTGRAIDARLPGTLASHIAAIQAGARILRVHDVGAHKDAIDMLNAIETRK